MTIAKSRTFKGGNGISPMTVNLKTWGHGTKYVVHTKNEKTKGDYRGFYTDDLEAGLKEFSSRVVALAKVEEELA